MLLIDWCNQNGNFGEQLLNQWVGVDIDGNRLDINSITHGCGKKVKWKCKEGHEWFATVNSRTAIKLGCKQCAMLNQSENVLKTKLKNSKSLQTWCEESGEYGKQILNEWTGLCEDGKVFLSPSDITSQSNKKLLWRCKKAHEWYARVQKRTLLGSKCPYCANQKIKPGENDLYTWCIKNNKLNLIEDWVGLDENNKEVSMDNVSKSTPKKVKWKHFTKDGDEHKWIARISDRTNNNSGCPFCNATNLLKHGVNDLETWCGKNKLGKILKRQWTGLTEYGDVISMNDIAFGSHTKLLWKCDCGRTWYADLPHRINNNKTVCPDCSIANFKKLKRIRDLENGKSLQDWCKEDSVIGQRLLEEWTGLTEEGAKIDISDITHGSTQRMVWKHTNDKGEVHKWIATIRNRTLNKSLCPHCNNKSSSLPEQIIYRCFKQIYPDTINRGKRLGYEFDIMIPDINTYIEYGSTYYHDGKEQRDQEKQELCDKLGVNFIAIMGYNDEYTEELWTPNKIITYI